MENEITWYIGLFPFPFLQAQPDEIDPDPSYENKILGCLSWRSSSFRYR